ncbi:retrotransposon gag protein [Cucumis melo var. makuwa]|uniref:Retrotransposon gag protein n=1 Tax=Cucumis melo var. makuwa TaxID=1194695 RepID=A0A5D3CB46_CUCMM|nr:retrotransposon gag protein [Cucumis melo var. makuwa]
MTRSSNLEFSYFEDLNREVRRIRRERKEENSIPNLSNQEPLRGSEPSRNTLDVAAGGALADKTPTEARELISRMAENSESFGNRASELDNSLTKEVSELKSQMLNMTTLLTSFVQGTPPKVTKCGVCGLVGHPNDKCPKVIEDVNIVRRYDPHSNTYNSGWRDNLNLRWGNDNQKYTQAPSTSSNQGTNLEDIIKALATNTLSFQQKMKQQMTQLTTAISKMDGKGKLPAQPDHANVSAISLRSGKILDTPTTKEKKLTSKPLPLNSKNESKEEKVDSKKEGNTQGGRTLGDI